MYDVSVAIPAYNAADCIERCIKSVQDQTWSGRLEILICDDGSTDDTALIIEDMAKYDKRIILLQNDRNLGRPFSRNKLFHNATCDMLTWLDADDYKFPDMIRLQMDKFFQTRCELQHENFLVYTNYEWDFAEQQEMKVIKPSPTKDSVRALLDGTFGAYLWITLGKKNAYAQGMPFNQNLPRLQDLDVFLKCAGRGIQFHRIDSVAPQCRYHKEDRGRNSLEVEKCFALIREEHRYLIEMYSDHYMDELKSKHLYVAARFAANNGDARRASRLSMRRSVARRISGK